MQGEKVILINIPNESKVIEEKDALKRFKRHKQFHQLDDIDVNKKVIEIRKEITTPDKSFSFDLNDY